MTHGFIDRHSGLNSPLHRLDPRAKIVAFSLAVLTVASAPFGDLSAFPLYYGAVGVLMLLSRVPLGYFLRRCLLASPFILMAASLPAVSVWLDAGATQTSGGASALHLTASIALKAYAAILLLTLLTATSRFSRLLWGLRRLKAPEILNVITTLMYRYIFVLLEEWQSASRARECRTAGRLRMGRFQVWGKQIATVFLRGWERAERVQASMLLRGFRGELPVGQAPAFGVADGVFLAFCAGVFLAIRVWA